MHLEMMIAIKSVEIPYLLERVRNNVNLMSMAMHVKHV